ncbi:zinc finger protein 764-like isoform X2 [Pithys albifrons albifrons]|uniref:zinc finger protein 764-like isoform X2 n=1 Tax=Pithys albifrons albifrons TaxID=3385563 RepID=UPI003A5CDE44
MQRGVSPEVSFEEVAIYFSPEEWTELQPWQRALYREVMADNYDLVASLESESKFLHVKEEPPGKVPSAGGDSGASDASSTGALDGSASEADDGELGFEPPAPGPPFVCGTCGKSFRHRRNLLTHKKLRGGVRARHGCDECGRPFCVRGDLLRHRRAQCGPARGLPCPRCQQRFSDAAGLGRHLAGPCEESPFVCERCGRGFAWRESLKLHVRDHHPAERPHPCPECGRAFRNRGHLRLHRRAHAGHRPFPCARCGRAFATRANLCAHRRLRRRCRPPAQQEEPPGLRNGDPRGDGDTSGD